MLPLLHAISSFSLLRGVLPPEKICLAALEYGYPALCIADRNNLYGYPVFLDACNRIGLTAITGAEVDDGNETALLFADGNEGFASLCEIISERCTSDAFSLTKAIAAHRQGIHVASTSRDVLLRCRENGPAYYLMQQPIRVPVWVKNSGIAVLIAPPAAFLSYENYATHRLLSAIRENTTISRLDTQALLPENALFTQSAILDEKYELFGAAVATTDAFARTIRPCTRPDHPHMPRFRADSQDLLRSRVLTGAVRRYNAISDTIKQRIGYELDIIIKKGFADYFLIVEDIVRQSPRTCGRGSGAASIVAYSLGITNVDPIRYNLMFERFLNPDRSDPPDIDIDFAWDERDGILDYVFKHYGKKHAAMVATHQTCGVRMAIREVARVYGLTEQEISAVTKKIPWFAEVEELAGDLEKTLLQWPAFSGASFDPPWSDILRDAGRIIGLPRGIGTHCGGVIITSEPIRSLAPVQDSAKGYPVVQWEKDGAEAMGLVKIDLLGNRSLAVIRDAIASIKSSGISFDEQSWDPQSDTETLRLLSEGRTMGVFYVESPAMRLLQRKSRKGDFCHMVIHSSIIRPAANKYIKEYVRRLHGGSWQPLHPNLEATLAETFGIMVYQEDVSKVAMALAGFSAAEADKLRKIIAKKGKGEVFDDYKSRFFSGASSKGVERSVAGSIWEMMESFKGYSFCKPHSASYVQVSFQSAFLKTHFPAHFMAAVLSNYGGFYTTQAYISEAMRLGLRIVSPDVNISDVAYRAALSSITVGMCQIKSLSRNAGQTIENERKKNGKYQSIEDLLERTLISETDAEALILAGAADNLTPGLNRPQQFWAMRRFYRGGQREAALPLRGNTPEEFVRIQYQALGFLASRHPISLVKAMVRRPPFRANCIDFSIGKRVTLFGWCVTSRTVSTLRGEAMEFVTFEDETGIFETVIFPNIYKKCCALLSWQEAFIISGLVTSEFNVATVEVESIKKIGP